MSGCLYSPVCSITLPVRARASARAHVNLLGGAPRSATELPAPLRITLNEPRICIYIYYIGEPMNLRDRTTVQNQQKRDPGTRKIPLRYVLKCGPKILRFPFYKMPTMDSSRRKMKEAHFIKNFKPKLNKY